MANPIIDDTNPNIVPGDMSSSETLATQGNVINSFRTFWEKLKARLGYAVFRNSETAKVGNDSKPVYVDSNGEVKECNATSITISLVNYSNFANGTAFNRMSYNPNNDNYNITLDIKPATGTMVYLVTSGNSLSTSERQIKIKDSNNNTRSVYYTSGAPALVKDFAAQATRFLLVYSNESGTDGRWIVLNKVNEAKGSDANSSNPTGSGGNAGLMSADDKAKLDSIQWGARRTLSWLDLGTMPAASKDSKGGVKLGSDTPINLTADKVYPVQVNNDGQMGVSVPWQNDNTHYKASIIAGKVDSTGNAASTEEQDTYIHILDKNDNTVESDTKIKLEGSGSVKISSDSAGIIIIRGEQYRAQKPTVTVSTIIRNSSGYLSGTLTFKDEVTSNVSVKVVYGGQAVGAESYTFNLNQLQVTAPTTNMTKVYYIPFYPIGRNDIMPGLVKLRVQCIVGGTSENPTYSYTGQVEVL